MSDFQTDVLRPSSLPTATLGRRRGIESTDTAEDLDKVSEEWNVRIDKEVKAVSSGLKDLIELADIGETPQADTSQINALHLKLKTSQLIRSAQGIRDIAHELKLMLLLSDQVEEAARRDREAEAVGKDVEAGRKEVGKEIRRLLGGHLSAEAGEGGIENAMDVDVDAGEEGQQRQQAVSREEGEKLETAAQNDVPIDEDEDEDLEEVA